MNFNIQKLKTSNELKSLLISIFVIIGTFPDNDWSFSVGIDPPLAWVFNNLFKTGLDIGKHIIFPHGPLAFFMYPLQENILLSTLVTSILKALLVFNVVWLFSDSKNQTKWLASFVFAYFFSIIAGFNHLLLANILLLYCNSYLSNKKVYKYLAFFITSFAFFVKAYVAILSGILFISFILYCFFNNKNIKHLFIDGFIMLGLILAFWLFMYGTFNGFIRYIFGMFHLAQDNSSAAAYYPYNNWLILILFLITITSIFLINRTKKSLFFGILIALSLFAAWKHGMAREDIYHVKGFLIYVIICLTVFVFFHNKNRYTNLILSIVAVFLFSINMKNSVKPFSLNSELFRVNNFIEFISEFNDLKQKATIKSGNEISNNKLPRKMLDSILYSTVDIYPWDYSIIAANNLNWQPRIVIQSYACYTSWLDQKNAVHFDSELAPNYLIWESNKILKNVNGGSINSIDNRYLLNDEPQTILSILTNYDFSIKESQFLLLKKRTKPLQIQKKENRSSESTWGKWIDVPENNGSLLRVKLNFSKTILQRSKSFLYKDEQFWIYLKLNNGSLHKYRIVPKNATDGIWINPYIFSFDKAYTVDKIMFKCSNQSILTNKLTVSWEQIEFNNNLTCIDNFFNINKSLTDSILLYSLNNYEQSVVNNWNNLSTDQLSDMTFSGSKSHLLKANSFSSTFSFQLDSIPFQNVKITADCWVKSPSYKLSNDIKLILTVDDKKGNIIWKGISIDRQLIDKKQWNNIYSFIEYKHITTNCTLNAYIWNTSNKDILIDDFRIMIVNSSDL